MSDIDLVVFDVLGTLVDEPGGVRRGIAELAPDADDAQLDALTLAWQEYVAGEQAAMAEGHRGFAGSEVLDREAARAVAQQCGIGDAASIDRLAGVESRLDPWPDSIDGLDRLARRFPIAGLSNADRSTLARLNGHTGMRWHFVLSAGDVAAYKPEAEVYRLAISLAGGDAERVLMVAAHAWDLRGAQALGMRTAYVERPVGDPPSPGDSFDLWATGLFDLADQLPD